MRKNMNNAEPIAKPQTSAPVYTLPLKTKPSSGTTTLTK